MDSFVTQGKALYEEKRGQLLVSLKARQAELQVIQKGERSEIGGYDTTWARVGWTKKLSPEEQQELIQLNKLISAIETDQLDTVTSSNPEVADLKQLKVDIEEVESAARNLTDMCTGSSMPLVSAQVYSSGVMQFMNPEEGRTLEEVFLSLQKPMQEGILRQARTDNPEVGAFMNFSMIET